MTSQGYRDWVNAGRPFSTAQPIQDLAATLRRYGYTVYTIGDNSHLQASTPEDHAPFSYTGWPNSSPRWWIHACDVMPGGALTLAQLGQQLVNDKNAGQPGADVIKYLNWTRADGRCVHESWEPGHNVTSSSDTGHIHISIRSDATHSGGMAGYDPVARYRAGSGAAAPTVTTGTVVAPPWPGRYLRYTAGQAMMNGSDVRTWQTQMARRGWSVTGDGYYGPRSADVCYQFQVEKRLTPDKIVGAATWSASWAAPVT